MSKLKRDIEYAALLKKLENAKQRSKNPEQVTGIYLEIAEYMRNSLFLEDEATKNYNKVLAWGKDFDACAMDCSLAYRNLAEIAIHKGDYDAAIERINLSLDYANKSGDSGLIQQALHQRAHICLGCDLPLKALEYAELCKDFILEHSDEIDQLRKDGDSRCRMAHLQNLMAAIYLELHMTDSFQQYGYDQKGLEINERAIKYSNENNDWVLYYRCLVLKLDLTVGKERLHIAELMCTIATKILPKNGDERKFKHDAKAHLALEKLRYCDLGNVSSCKKLLWKCYEDAQKEEGTISADIYEAIKRALVFVYKVEQREHKANSMNVKDNRKRRHAQMVIFEKIGDDASAMGMNEIALHFYQKMLKCADSVEDQRKSWCSMAEAAKDCRLWERALAFYVQLRSKEVELGYTEEQLLETDISLAIISAEVDSLTPKERLKKFEDVYNRCIEDRQKRCLLPDYIKFLKAHPNLCSKEELEKMKKEKNRLDKDEQNGQQQRDEQNIDDEDERVEADEFDEMGEEEIFFSLKKEMKAIDRQEKIIKGRSNKNKHGESSLHEVARTDDYQQLKELIEKGYNVNQLDHGGWTPLSEAVSAQKLANVRLLLMKGANPNTRSTEFLVDNDQNKTTSSGLTPLMEACSSGNIEIAKILIQFKARTSTKDDDDWTALEYLSEHILNAQGLDRQKRERLQKFAETLREKQMEEGFAPRNDNEFLEMLELKKVSSLRKSGRESSFEKQKEHRTDDDIQPMSPDQPHSSKSTLRERIVLISDESEDEGHENYYAEEDKSGDEGTKNLQDYRKIINGLKNRRTSDETELTKTSLSIGRKRLSSGKSGPSAKKLFFK